jgi:hypothetical protein
LSPLALAVIRAAGRGGSAGPDVLVQVALVVVLVGAGRTCAVRVVRAGCPVTGAPGRGRDLVVPAQIMSSGPVRSMLACPWADAVITVPSGRGGACPAIQGNAERWPEPATGWSPGLLRPKTGHPGRPGGLAGAAGRRFGLWVLLHAQALLRGTAGGRDVVAVIEDDYRRLAGWRRT